MARQPWALMRDPFGMELWQFNIAKQDFRMIAWVPAWKAGKMVAGGKPTEASAKVGAAPGTGRLKGHRALNRRAETRRIGTTSVRRCQGADGV